LSKMIGDVRKIDVPTTMPMMMLTASQSPSLGTIAGSGIDCFADIDPNNAIYDVFEPVAQAVPDIAGCQAQPDLRRHSVPTFIGVCGGFGLDLSPSDADNAAVGSANVSLLAASFWSAASASFSRTSWRAAILGPFLCSPESNGWAVPFSNCRRCTHGKEALLWQSEL
jgi:hypothetical protein